MGRTSPHVIAFPSLLGCNPSTLLLLGKLKTKAWCAFLKVMQLAEAELGLGSSGLAGSKAEAVSQSVVSGVIQERRLGTGEDTRFPCLTVGPIPTCLASASCL